ncbi:MAG: SRPBCC family protein [Deltaproteobacteria bacterium]|nr:SRPBCC family protein [Deltaproteobacteria bacterium]
MSLASKSVVVNAPIEKLIGVIYDYERYSEFLSEIKWARVVKRDGARVICDFEASLVGYAIHYTLDFVETPPTSLKWTLAKADRMTVNTGGWTLRDEGGGRTHATYAIEVLLTGFVPKMIQRKVSEMTLPGVLEKFKRRAESLK